MTHEASRHKSMTVNVITEQNFSISISNRFCRSQVLRATKRIESLFRRKYRVSASRNNDDPKSFQSHATRMNIAAVGRRPRAA